MIKVPEKHSPSPSEVTDYSCNTEASLSGSDGRVEGVGENNHGAAEEQYVRTHTQPECQDIGENAERSVKASSKATLGRHVTSEEGSAITERRRRVNAENRKASEKVFHRGAAK